jgi:autotransporter-associated beta strand protein
MQRLMTWIAVAIFAVLSTAHSGRATDFYWDRNSTTIYGDAGGSWQSTTGSTNNPNFSTSSSGTLTTAIWTTSYGSKSVTFGFGPAPANTGAAGIVSIGNSTNPSSGNVSVGTIVMNASGTGGYTFRSPSGNAGSTLTINTGGADVPAGYGIIVSSSVTGTTSFAATSSSSVMKMALGARQAWQNNSTAYPLVVGVPVSGTVALSTEGPGVIVLGTANTFTGGVTVSSGTLQVAHATALSTGPTTIAAAGMLDVRAAVAKPLSGAGSVTIGPAGGLTATSLPTGGFAIAGDAVTPATFTTTSATPFTISAATLGGYSTISMPATSGLLASGAVTIAGTDNQLILSGVASPGNTYTLLQGASLANTGAITLGGAAVGNQTLLLGTTGTIGRTEYTFQSTPTALQLVVTGSQYTLTWTGAVDNVWNESTANWTTGAGSTNFYAGDNAIINTAAAITVRPEGVVANQLTIGNASAATTLTGGTVSAIALTKSGAGDFGFDNAIVAETMTVTSGTVAVSGAGMLAVSGTLTNNTRVAFTGSADQAISAVLSGTGTLASLGSGSVTLAAASPAYTGRLETGAGSTLAITGNGLLGPGGVYSGAIANDGGIVYSGAGAQTLAGTISGGGTLAKAGNATLVVSGNNTFAGATTVSAGTLKVGSATALGSAAGDTTVSSGAVLDLNGQSVAAEPLSLYGTGISTSGALVNSNTSSPASWGGAVGLYSAQTGIGGAGSTTISGNINGGGGLYKYGEGQVTLSGANSFTGTLYITSGTVRVMDQAALPNVDLQWFQSNSSAGLDLVAPGTYPMASIGSFGSMLRVGTSGTGTVTLAITGGSTLTGNADKKMQVNERATVVLNGDVTASSSTVNRSLVLYPGGDVVINGALWGGGTGPADNFGLMITSNTTGQNGGTVSLNNVNFYTGLTAVSAGTLKLGNALALGDTFKGLSISAVAVTDTTTGITTTRSQGTVDLNGYSINDEALTMTGTAGRVSLVNSNASTPATWGGAANTVSLSGTVAMGGAGDLTMDRPVSGSGRLAKTGASPGTLTVSGSVTLGSGGNYNWQMLSATGTAGSTSSWDLLAVGGPLTIASTPTDPFKINLWTLSGIAPDVSGSAANFDASSNYTWKIATATGGITGFATSKFLITTSATNGTGGFANAFGSGTFSLAQSGNDLNLVFTAGAPTVITINVATGTQTQTQAGYPTLSGSVPVVKTGAGTLVLTAANTLTGSTTVQGGRLQLADGAALGSSKVVPLAGGTLSLTPYLQATVGGLAPNAGGLTDVGSGLVTVAAGLSAADMVNAIVTGLGDGSWNGTSGITSSVAATSGGDRTVGWLDNGDGTVTFGFAAAGDTNLDWQVDIIDAANFLAGGKFDTGSPATWNEGDFTYDGVVDILDAASFLSNGLFDAGSYNPPASQAGGIAAVPEPTALSLLACGAVAASGCLTRRNRRILRA